MECKKLVIILSALVVLITQEGGAQYLCRYGEVTKYCCECCKKDCCTKNNKKPLECPTPAPFSSASGSSDVSTPLVVGGVVAGVTVVALLVVAVCVCTKREGAGEDPLYTHSSHSKHTVTSPTSIKTVSHSTVSSLHAGGPPTARPAFLGPSAYY